jgi:hypothetical protein
MFGASMAASMAMMQMQDQMSAATTIMQGMANARKMLTDAVNSITQGQMDTANKGTNAGHKIANEIQF